MSETDLIRGGSTLWVWESASNTVTKLSLAGHGTPGSKKAASIEQVEALTPQQAANDALQAVGKTSVVSVDSAVTVAGQAAYELVLAPKDSRSTIGSIRIAIDGKTGVPLRVQVFAKGPGSPAFQVGYTEISYGAPSPGNFTFTPPPGATFDDTTKPQAGHKAAQEPDVNGTTGTYGAGWLTVAEVPATSAGTSPAGPSAGSPSTGASARTARRRSARSWARARRCPARGALAS